MFHPIGTCPTGHDDTGRKAVEVRQRLTVHLVGDESVRVHRLPDGYALNEIGSFVDDRPVRAIEDDFDSLLLDADLVEQVLESCALPAGAAHGAIAPLNAGNVWLEQAAPVTGTLIDGDDFDGRHLLEVIKGDLGLSSCTISADRQLPRRSVDLRNVGEVVANKERLVRRNRRAEILYARLVVGRAIAELHQRLFTGARIDYRCGACAFGQFNR